MPKTLFLQNASPPFTPTLKGAWDLKSGGHVVHAMGSTKSGDYEQAWAIINGLNAADFDTVVSTAVSVDTVLSAGDLAGTATFVVMTQDFGGTANCSLHVHLWVTVGNTDTVRGTLLATRIDSEIWTTTREGRGEATVPVVGVSVSPGDRIVAEFGVRDNASGFTFPGVYIGRGGTGTTLAENVTDTTNPGFVTLSDTNNVFSGPLPTPTGSAVIASGPTDWTVYIRHNQTLDRMEQCDDYRTLDMALRFNDVGTWTMDIDRRANPAARLSDPAYGIEVVRGTTTVMSGPVTSIDHTRDVRSSLLTVAGKTDDVWLARRLAMPQPGSAAPPYSTTEYDVRSGVASTVLRSYVDVNLATGAIVPRQVPGLILGPDPTIGDSVTGRGRFQNLLVLLQELATAGGVGFRIIQDWSQLVFQTYQPLDVTTYVKFSLELGNLAGYSYTIDAPERTYVVCAGGGEGTARTVVEGGNSEEVLTWGRIEEFRDRRDTTDASEMSQTITEELAEGGQKTALSISPVDTPTQRYLDHYRLGDTVSVLVDGETVQEVVREVKIGLKPGEQRIVPVLGSSSRRSVLALFDRFVRLNRRLTDLERR